MHYFKNYFVTGDYAVAGVGLYGTGKSGVATGTINMNGVPQGADIVAAFLYWQTVEAGPSTSTPKATTGTFVSNGTNNAIVGAVIGATPAPACWTPAGTTAPSATAVTRVYRADVLRYLPIDSTNNIRVADGSFKVQLPDSGNSSISTIPHTMGASLVVVYRILQVGGAPYKAVVIYDGASTLTRTSAAFSQTIGGFYQASGIGAKMTQIVGNGQPSTDVYLTVNGNYPLGLIQDVFVGAAGPRWDNPTFGINLPVNASSLQTQVLAVNSGACLSWSAVITSTNVVNTDGDGILDSWKVNGLHLNVGTVGNTVANPPVAPVAATFGGCAQYPADPCENFPKMGAVLGNFLRPHKDVFVQIDWMKSSIDGHIHSPKLAALQAIANVFSTHNIYLHFDVGKTYYQNFATSANNYMIVPAAYAQGGNAIQEEQNALECPNSVAPVASDCAFPGLPYSVVGWKKGFDAIKNGFGILGIPQYFPHDRKDTFHYILFGHALAGPFNQQTGLPLNPGTPPSSVSGVADTPGGDLLITLGLWGSSDFSNCLQDDPTGLQPFTNLCTNQTGTWYVQAGTMMHELGHNMGLYHGGAVKLPNCMPDYPSVMSYLYQTKLLEDTSGNLHVDFSNGFLAGLNENSLYEARSLGPLSYKVRYYAPPNPSISGQSAAVSQYHCDGTPATGNMEIELKSNGLVTPDWNNNGKADAAPVAVDINYNGTIGSVTADSVQPSDTYANDPRKLWFVDHNDWGNLNFQQIGGRLNVNGLSADVSAADLGQADLGQADLGQADLGQADLGQADLGKDVDYNAATSSLEATGSTTPLVVSITAASTAITNDPGNNQITLSWGPPNIGQIQTYTVYRLDSDHPNGSYVVAGTVPAMPLKATYTFNDIITDIAATDAATGVNCYSSSNSNGGSSGTSPCFNTHYNYYITATAVNRIISTPSNVVTGVIVNHLFVTAYSGSVIYGNTLPNFSGAAATVTGLPSGGITSSSFTCTNTTGSVPPRNVGSYTIACTGTTVVGSPATTGVTYITGTLKVTQRPVTITAVTNTKLYDGTNSANAIPVASVGTATSGTGLVNDDTITSAETYDNKNAGSGKTLSVTAVVVSDGNNGGNYSPVTNVTNVTGVITQRPLTIAAVTNTKIYDGTNSASALPIPVAATSTTGLVLTDTITAAETYDNKNAGTGKTLSVSTYSVNDGNSGGNYAPVTTTTVVTGEISKRSLTINAVAIAKIYDGTTLASAIPTVSNPTSTTGLVPTDSVTGRVESYASPNAGPEALLVSAYTVSDGNGGLNYSVTLTSVNGLINQRPLTIDAVTNTKAYDGNTSASAVPVVEDPTSTSGLVLSDNVTGQVETYAGPNAGSETLTVTAYTVVDGNSGLNYTVALVSAEGTINPDPLTAAIKKVPVVSSSSPPAFKATYTGFVNHETATVVTGTLSCTLGTAQDTSNKYPISCTGVGASNYNISFDYSGLSGIDAAIPAPLTVYVAGTTQLVSSTPTFTLTSFTYSGFVNGDSPAVVSGTLSCTAEATADTSGNYPISCSGLSAADYTITYSYSPGPGPISAAPAPLTVAVAGAQPVGGTPTYTLTYSGFLNGNTISIVTGTLSCNTDATASSDAGSYAITSCTGLSAPTSYSVVYWPGTVTVFNSD